jgi:hypothetical protein
MKKLTTETRRHGEQRKISAIDACLLLMNPKLWELIAVVEDPTLPLRAKSQEPKAGVA